VQPLHLLRRGRAACHYADRRRALSAFNVSRPIRWQAASRSSNRRRACWVSGKQCVRAKRHAILILPSTRSFPCTTEIRRSRVSEHKKIVSATDISRFQALYSLCPWAHMSGPSPFVHAPSSYKRGGMQRYTHTQSYTTPQTRKLKQAHKQYITQWSRVLRSGGPNHSKSLCVLAFFPFILTIKQNA
jgi:hypothetical protein